MVSFTNSAPSCMTWKCTVSETEVRLSFLCPVHKSLQFYWHWIGIKNDIFMIWQGYRLSSNFFRISFYRLSLSLAIFLFYFIISSFWIENNVAATLSFLSSGCVPHHIGSEMDSRSCSALWEAATFRWNGGASRDNETSLINTHTHRQPSSHDLVRGKQNLCLFIKDSFIRKKQTQHKVSEQVLGTRLLTDTDTS